MTRIDEIAPDLFRLCTWVPQADLQFNAFLVRDEEPLLFHTGLRAIFPSVRRAVEKILDPASIRWIGFSHFEADECGALNEWLALAPRALPLCGTVGALVNVNDFATRRTHVLEGEDVLETGRRRFRFLPTPHVPHGWDAGLLWEETERTLFCSDLCIQKGEAPPTAGVEILDRARETLRAYEAGPLAGAFPWTPQTSAILAGLADLEPRCLAVMHGASFVGEGRGMLMGLSGILKEVLAVGAVHMRFA